MLNDYITKALKEADFRKALQYFICTIIIASAFAVLLIARAGDSFDTYLSKIIPFLIAYGIFYAYVTLIKGSLTIVFVTSYISICAISLMSIIAPASVSKHISGMYIAMIIYAIIKLFMDKFCDKKWILWLMLVANALIYGVLMLQPPSEDLDYTRAWLVVGGFSFQLTELIKIIAVCYLAVLYTAEVKNKQRMFFLYLFLGINGLGSLGVLEFGSLLVLIMILAAGTFILEDKKKNLLIFWASIVALFLIGLLLMFLLNGRTGPPDESLIQHAINRLFGRFSSEDRYQINQALKAMSCGSAFGSFKTINIPEHSNDFAFASMVLCMGSFIAITFLCAFIAFIYIAFRRIPVNDEIKGFDKKVAVIAVLFIALQSALIIFINLDVLPITGVNCFFLSSGGASQIISYTMAIFVFSATGKNYNLMTKRKESISNEAVRKI